MASPDHDTNPDGLEMGPYRLGYLIGQTLLYLEPPGKDIDQAGEFGEPKDFPIRDIPDMNHPEKGAI